VFAPSSFLLISLTMMVLADFSSAGFWGVLVATAIGGGTSPGLK
jgi:hypothetical protein